MDDTDYEEIITIFKKMLSESGYSWIIEDVDIHFRTASDDILENNTYYAYKIKIKYLELLLEATRDGIITPFLMAKQFFNNINSSNISTQDKSQHYFTELTFCNDLDVDTSTISLEYIENNTVIIDKISQSLNDMEELLHAK